MHIMTSTTTATIAPSTTTNIHFSTSYHAFSTSPRIYGPLPILDRSSGIYDPQQVFTKYNPTNSTASISAPTSDAPLLWADSE